MMSALESMDSGEVTGLLFLDISKAFDSLNHKVKVGVHWFVFEISELV